ncbi:MAG: pyrroline-5-carboxylate reductase family protein [Chloroflexota bacterium]
MRKSIGFIGGGKITKMLIRGFENRKVNFKRVIIADSNPLVFDRLKNEFPSVHADSASVAAAQDIVFLAIDQKLLMDTLGLISNEFKSNTIVVSLIPEISMAKLALRLPNVNKMARILPTSATFINKAYVPIAFSPDFPASEKDDVVGLFGHLGKVIEVPEDKLQTYFTMSSVIPAYFWHQWKELISMGTEMGLTERETVDFLGESVLSSLDMSYRSGLPEEEVISYMPVNPVEENDSEIRGIYRKRLIDLYRKARPEVAERASGPEVR